MLFPPRFIQRKLFAKLFGKSMLLNWSFSPFHIVALSAWKLSLELSPYESREYVLVLCHGVIRVDSRSLISLASRSRHGGAPRE